jgi:hypothetical protein
LKPELILKTANGPFGQRATTRPNLRVIQSRILDLLIQ